MSQILSETFWALLLTTVSGFVLLALKYCYKSKCTSIDMCCIKIIRSVDTELKIDLQQESKTDESNKV